MTTPMTNQLEWFRKDDWTEATRCGRYEIKRRLNYDQHPATGYEYLPKSAANCIVGAGPCKTSELARAACQDDLQQLQQAAATTKG